MKKLIALSMMTGLLALGGASGLALADDHNDHRDGYRDRERCTMVRKCHWHDGARMCERVRVCRDRH